VPNPYLVLGADLVVYSGGKIIRGPQSAGLLVGRRDLVRAAWANSAPHHAFGRALKVSKEEIVGMLRAVEIWRTGRDVHADFREWNGWYRHIKEQITRLKKEPGKGPGGADGGEKAEGDSAAMAKRLDRLEHMLQEMSDRLKAIEEKLPAKK